MHFFSIDQPRAHRMHGAQHLSWNNISVFREFLVVLELEFQG